MRDKELRLEHLKDLINDLEQDYKSVSTELRAELDIPTRNRLERRLTQIGQEMEKIEREIEKLEQALQQEAIQASWNGLRTILQQHESLFQDMQTAYKRTLTHWQCSVNPSPNASDEFVTELLRIPQGQSVYRAIEQFAGYLVKGCIPEDTSLLAALQTWGERYVKNWSELLEQLDNFQAQQAQAAQPVLMIVVDRRDEASTQSQEGNRYQIRAWLIQDSEQYKTQRQGYGAILIEGTKEETTYLEAELLDKIPLFLAQFLGECSNEYINELEIHIFLPLALMNHAVDCWELDDGYGVLKRLGQEYKVVVRSTERLHRNYRQRPRWVQRWRQHQSSLQKIALEVFTSGDDTDLEELSDHLDEVMDQIVGLKVTQAPSYIGRDSLFGVLLQSGLPLAIWGRCNLQLSTNEIELNRVLQDCCLASLPGTVKTERKKARKKDKDCHIGHHLSLLWDDPDLVPPKTA